jgi:hypothetical protein
MDLEIVKFNSSDKDQFLGSVSANWLSELDDPGTLTSFSDKFALPENQRNW